MFSYINKSQISRYAGRLTDVLATYAKKTLEVQHLCIEYKEHNIVWQGG